MVYGLLLSWPTNFEQRSAVAKKGGDIARPLLKLSGLVALTTSIIELDSSSIIILEFKTFEHRNRAVQSVEWRLSMAALEQCHIEPEVEKIERTKQIEGWCD